MTLNSSIKVFVPVLSLAVGVAGLMPIVTAHADTTTALQLTSFYQIVADTAHNHLLISQGSSSQNHIIVTNLSGKQVATIGSQNGVEGIALSPDGKTLYAALGSSGKISVAVRLTQADLGYHYRIRADYIRSSKDTTNLSNDSAWQYFIVKR